jgi:glycogen debranching enzyme
MAPPGGGGIGAGISQHTHAKGFAVTAWTPEQVPSAVTPDAVTLIEGTAFCICGSAGDILPGGTDGVFYRDTRVVSRWELLVDDEPVEPLAVVRSRPFCATFVGRSRPRPGHAEGTILITRARYVGDGMREDITVHNYSEEHAALRICLRVESDLADIFDVKAHRTRQWGERSTHASREGLVISSRLRDRTRGVRVTAGEASVLPDEFTFEVVVPPRDVWHDTVTVQPVIDGHEVTPHFPPGQPVTEAGPVRRQSAWERSTPYVTTDHASLVRALRRSQADLGSLRIFDADHPDSPPVVAAGAPWFMTLFGRDSIIASWMALPLDRSLALGTVKMLASLQGESVDPVTEEEPGKILHELRHGLDSGMLPATSHGAYFGSVDATPLFVMLVGELVRWGLDDQPLAELLPHVDRALGWIEKYGDLDGDSFVEYRRKTDRGLVNQGWKDSYDGINFASGALAQAPIALAEVQGYVYAAYLARANIARTLGDAGTRQEYERRAAALKRKFNEAFWLPDKGWYAVGLDRDKRPIDALASNMGHCLLTGIADVDKAETAAGWLMSPQMFSGWGVRTLASTMSAYNPMSYHNGSVWPHDNALIAAGLMRYGFVEQAQRIALGLLDAADAFDGRLPELFCGFDRREYPEPLPYPTSCSPQAWAAASPVHLLRVLLRFDPCIPCGRVWLAPALPPVLARLSIGRLSLAGERVSIEVSRDRLHIRGLPPGLRVVHEPEPLPDAMPELKDHP